MGAAGGLLRQRHGHRNQEGSQHSRARQPDSRQNGFGGIYADAVKFNGLPHKQKTLDGIGRAAGLRVHVKTAKLELQRLKPHSLCGTHVVAKAATHKDSAVLRQAT
jgi:hypothetical protein